MIIGIHALVYSRKADEARAFFRDVLDLPCVDAGEGWLIFRAPPAELAVHPTDADEATESSDDVGCDLYLMCDDIRATIDQLRQRGVEFTQEIKDQGYGLFTALRLPGGGNLGLYEPRHRTALRLAAAPMVRKRAPARRSVTAKRGARKGPTKSAKKRKR